MSDNILITTWRAYRDYIGRNILSGTESDLIDISYWRDRVFCSIMAHLLPFSIIALIPSVLLSVREGLGLIAVSDLIAFVSMLTIALWGGIRVRDRKMIFFTTLYSLTLVLLYYHSSMTGGMMFLLTNTVLICVIYSTGAAYYSALLNAIICLSLGVLMYLGIIPQFVKDYNTSIWTGVSFTLIFLCLVCTQSMGLLLRDLEAFLDAKNISEGNLRATIENTDAYVYSLDTDFRYIIFNLALKNTVKQMYNVDVNPGDKVFNFLEKEQPEDAYFWKNVYSDALTGKVVRFEKDFNTGDYHRTAAFSLNPIIDGESIAGLSCFAADITELRQTQLALKQLNNELELTVARRTSELMAANQELAFERDEKAKRAAELVIANQELVFQNQEKAKRAEELATANKELKKTQEELVISNQELESFSYSVSHDLRAPLRAVESYAQMLEEDYSAVLDDNGKRLLSIIQQSGTKMGMLIDDLLALSRLGKKEINKTKVNMNELVNRVIDDLILITHHKVSIIIGTLPSVSADASLMNQVLVNLLGNALKYSAKTEKPEIDIGSYEENGEVVFSIADNGAGFDMRYADKLFGVFQRLHSENEFKGTGVGLAIVKRIIDKHGGRIWAESEIGRGASFYFTLPTG